jgi:hypothetical protein
MPKEKNFNKTSRSFIARILRNLFCGYFVIWILHFFFVCLKVLNLCHEFKVHEFTTPNLGFDIDVNMTTHLLPIIVIILVTMLHCNVHQIWKRKITWLKWKFSHLEYLDAHTWIDWFCAHECVNCDQCILCNALQRFQPQQNKTFNIFQAFTRKHTSSNWHSTKYFCSSWLK